MPASATTSRSRRRSIAQGRALIAAWKASGMSAQGYCRARKLSNSRIGYWKRRLRQLEQDDQTASPAASAAFIQIKPPVKTMSAAIAAGMEVTLPNGLRLSLSPHAPLPWVTTMLQGMLRLDTPC